MTTKIAHVQESVTKPLTLSAETAVSQLLEKCQQSFQLHFPNAVQKLTW